MHLDYTAYSFTIEMTYHEWQDVRDRVPCPTSVRALSRAYGPDTVYVTWAISTKPYTLYRNLLGISRTEIGMRRMVRDVKSPCAPEVCGSCETYVDGRIWTVAELLPVVQPYAPDRFPQWQWPSTWGEFYSCLLRYCVKLKKAGLLVEPEVYRAAVEFRDMLASNGEHPREESRKKLMKIAEKAYELIRDDDSIIEITPERKKASRQKAGMASGISRKRRSEENIALMHDMLTVWKLEPEEIMLRLGISERSFFRYRKKLEADGLLPRTKRNIKATTDPQISGTATNKRYLAPTGERGSRPSGRKRKRPKAVVQPTFDFDD